jgi:hypothetical protein
MSGTGVLARKGKEEETRRREEGRRRGRREFNQRS